MKLLRFLVLIVIVTLPTLLLDASEAKQSLYEVQLAKDRAPAAIRELAERGIEIRAHFRPGRIVVFATPSLLAEIDGIVSKKLFDSREGLGKSLEHIRSSPQKSSKPIDIIVGLVEAEQLQHIGDTLSESGARIRWMDDNPSQPEIGLRVEADRLEETLAAVGRTDGLLYADAQAPTALRNSSSVWRCQSGQFGQTPIFDHGLHGENQIIGIMDTGIDADMCYFADDEHGLPVINDRFGTTVSTDHRKILAIDFYWSSDWPDPGIFDWDSQSHGTHVAGSVAGDSGITGQHDGNDGMAPAAKLVIQDGGYRRDSCGDLPGLGCPMQNLEPMLEQAWEQGARIHSNSWGDEEDAWPTNLYTARTADVDRFVWQHPEMLVLFAAGNAGGHGVDTIGSPGTGKNTVAVGATLNGFFDPPCPVWFSSRGWTHDGRIKPDVIAPGTDIRSALTDFNITTGNCDTTQMSGTSMACPTAAGLAALIRQYFVDGYYPSGRATAADAFVPSAALLKAMLIASAVDVSTLGCGLADPIPSRDQGWGLIQLDTVLTFSDHRHNLMVVDSDESLENSTGYEQAFVTSTQAPLKIVLVWTDPPSNPAADTNLVNDLDLILEGPSGVWKGNVFADGLSVSGGSADRLNNVEVIMLAAAPAGAWTVRVNPQQIIEGPQGFALVVRADLAPDRSRRPRNNRRFSSNP